MTPRNNRVKLLKSYYIEKLKEAKEKVILDTGKQCLKNNRLCIQNNGRSKILKQHL